MKINLLTADVYNKIAAGEVVDRPYSVVKELVENAVDAGAKEITVEIDGSGKRRIRVTDNGGGMSKEDLPLAYAPHATSKLKTVDDLFAIRTLGFRGEAIASVAAVSKMEIVSRTADDDTYSLRAEGGALGKVVPAAGAKGTVVTVDDLFYNVPARLKFLKSDAQEEADIGSVMTRFILAHPDISFNFLVNGKMKYRSFGDGLSASLAAVYGPSILNDCVEIDAEKHGIRIRGFLGNRNFFKPNRTWQSLFVNGRYVVNQTVGAAVSNAYASYLMKRQYPFYVLFLDVPPEIVDVNVHPNKADVRFADNQIVYGCVYSVVSAVLDGNSRALEYLVAMREETVGPKTQTASHSSVSEPAMQPENNHETGSLKADAQASHVANVKGADGSSVSAGVKAGASADMPASHAADVCRGGNLAAGKASAGTAASRPALRAEESGKDGSRGTMPMSYEAAKAELKFDVTLPKRSEPRLLDDTAPVRMEVRAPSAVQDNVTSAEDIFAENRRLILEQAAKAKQERIEPSSLAYKGELFRTYLIYESGDNAYLIDQHAAHERILYNRLREKWENRKVISQPMLTPFLITVNGQEFAFLEKNLPLLREIGFEIDAFGDDAVKVSAVPVELMAMDLKAFFAEVLSSMETLRAIRLTDILKDKLATAACKAAVKGGERLGENEARELIENMDGDMGMKCPHGRPAVVKIKKSELEKLFKRIV